MAALSVRDDVRDMHFRFFVHGRRHARLCWRSPAGNDDFFGLVRLRGTVVLLKDVSTTVAKTGNDIARHRWQNPYKRQPGA